MKKLLSSLSLTLLSLPVLAQSNAIFTSTARDLWSDVSTAAPMIMAVFTVLGLIAGLVQYISPSGDWRKYAGMFVVFCIVIVAISGIVKAVLSLSFS